MGTTTDSGSSERDDGFGWVDESDPAGFKLTQGGQISVTWGEEVLQPVQFNGFRVGPISMTAPILPGETPREAYERVWNALNELAEKQFVAKAKTFGDHFAQAKKLSGR